MANSCVKSGCTRNWRWREIQQGFLPRQVDGLPLADLEILGRVFPARQVAGDFYDYFAVGDRLAFFIGDVSGKGMPAALFMVAVRTLCRSLVKDGGSLVQTLIRLNAALADDNPSCMFVTLIHGLYEPASGKVNVRQCRPSRPLFAPRRRLRGGNR